MQNNGSKIRFESLNPPIGLLGRCSQRHHADGTIECTRDVRRDAWFIGKFFTPFSSFRPGKAKGKSSDLTKVAMSGAVVV